jgi:hypothetical protein
MDKEFLLSCLKLENELSEHQKFVPQHSIVVCMVLKALMRQGVQEAL